MTGYGRQPAARTLAQMLAARAPELVAELLPRGRREGPEWRCGSLAGEPGRSLGVRLTGSRAGVWADFASGEAGDALDLVAAVLYRGDRAAAVRWARRWLFGDGPAPLPAAPPPPREAREAEGAEEQRKRRIAVAIFAEARPWIAGSPVASYLEERGITLAELGRQPAALRYHPACWCAEASAKLPAMVAAVVDAEGRHVATHRTWLERDESRPGRWRKARLQHPKKAIGSFAGGHVPLWQGASGVPLARAPEGETVAIAEGIETALSVAVACPELRVLAAVSSGNLPKVALPPAVRTVILCADNDGDNAATARAIERAVDRFTAEGREVRIARSPVGKDFNDALTAAREASGP